MASQKIVLHFPETVMDEPVVCRLVKHYELDFNIIKAQIQPKREGLMVLELSGDAKKLKAGLKWARDLGIRIQPLEQDVVRDRSCAPTAGPARASARSKPSPSIAIRGRSSSTETSASGAGCACPSARPGP